MKAFLEYISELYNLGIRVQKKTNTVISLSFFYKDSYTRLNSLDLFVKNMQRYFPVRLTDKKVIGMSQQQYLLYFITGNSIYSQLRFI